MGSMNASQPNPLSSQAAFASMTCQNNFPHQSKATLATKPLTQIPIKRCARINALSAMGLNNAIATTSKQSTDAESGASPLVGFSISTSNSEKTVNTPNEGVRGETRIGVIAPRGFREQKSRDVQADSIANSYATCIAHHVSNGYTTSRSSISPTRLRSLKTTNHLGVSTILKQPLARLVPIGCQVERGSAFSSLDGGFFAFTARNNVARELQLPYRLRMIDAFVVGVIKHLAVI